MPNTIERIYKSGQSIWYDNLSRSLIESGELQRQIELGIVGLTSNPTILMKAITGSADYDARLARMAAAGEDVLSTYERLVLPDIRDAADLLRPVYDRTDGVDGYVSLEVNPKLAFDTQGTIVEARRLFAALDQPNICIKVPATPEGMPAVATLIGEGINVNVTLIFSLAMYERVMQAYLDGLDRLHSSGGDVTKVASVASFFISRVDTLADALLDERATGGAKVEHLRGRAGVANARLAYARFEDTFAATGPFAKWQKLGARVQRPLWASTSTKNPAYPPTLYVDELIGPNTVNTLPPPTIELALKQGSSDVRIRNGLDDCTKLFDELAAVNVHIDEITDQLLQEGVEAFATSFDQLLAGITAKQEQLRVAG